MNQQQFRKNFQSEYDIWYSFIDISGIPIAFRE